MYRSDISSQKVEEQKQGSKSALAVPLLSGDVEEVEVENEKEHNSKLSKGKKKVETKLDKFRRYLKEHQSKAVIGAIYVLINVILYVFWAIMFWNKPNMFVTIARGFGMMLNFNCALILVPVLRNVITTCRATFLHRFIPFDSNIMFHRRIAWVIAFATAGHGIAHYFNYSLQDRPYMFAYGTMAGITGNVLVWIMALMYTSAIDAVRRRYFNTFWFTHHLFVPFYILLLFHGPRFWAFFLVPGIAYLLERVVREFRGKQSTTVSQVILHPSDVVEIRMRKKSFKYKPGQYLYLNCPKLSPYEWHPFTISSAPHEDFVSCHIRCVGPWTKGFRDFLAPEQEGVLDVEKSHSPEGTRLVRIDGPFGAASEEVFDFKVLMLIGAGIGVTPFASILKALLHRKRTSSQCKVEKVHFYWICREYKAFEWFQTLLRDWEVEMHERKEDFLEINIHLTQKMEEQDLNQMRAKVDEKFDPVTALEARTNYTRPDFDKIFDDMKVHHQGTKIGLFFCGPRILAKDLRRLCMAKSTRKKRDGAKFIFHKENF